MGLGKKTIDDQNYCGKKVLVRCDFNVPMKDGVITNENRINAALPTIQKLVNDGAKVILCSHLGKPKNGPEAKFSLAPVAVALSAKLGKTVVFADDDNVVGENAKAAVAAMNNGDVVLLQNTRFRKEETKNMPEFSEELASLADAYVDDAFGSCHRAHCSTAGVTDYIKDTAVGYLMEKEIKYLGNAVNDPVRPFTAILGGAKVADKLNVISNLLEKVDTLIIGGGMAYTFVKAQGYEVGKSLCDDTKLDYCKEMMAKAKEKGVKLLLPVDAVCIKDFPDPIDAPVDVTVVPVTAIPADMEGCDIGPETMKLFADAVKASKTVVWNGPMGALVVLREVRVHVIESCSSGPVAVQVDLIAGGVVGIEVDKLGLAGGSQDSIGILNAVLGAVDGLDVCLVALEHGVGDLAVAVQVELVIVLEDVLADHLALQMACLGGVGADECDVLISVQDGSGSLDAVLIDCAVEEDNGHIAGQLHDALRGVGRTGGDHVDDQQVIAVSDCGLDGLVLRGLVAVGVEVLIGNAQRVQLCIESGADAGDVGVGIGVVEHGDLQIDAHRGVAVAGILSGVGSGLRIVRRCLGLVAVAAAGDQSNDHDKDKKKRKKFFHCHSSSINFCGISVPRN